jgi:hypothetical protein
LNAASKGVVAGIADFAFLISSVWIRGCVQRADWDVGGSFGIGGRAAFGFELLGNEEEQ